jgi:hypothetical protein
LQFKGREMAHLELGRDIFKKIKEQLWEVSKVERDAKMEGRRMTLVLQPDRKAPGAKPPVPGQSPQQRSGPFQAGSGLNIPQRPPVAAAAPAANVTPRPAPAAAAPAPAPVSR